MVTLRSTIDTMFKKNEIMSKADTSPTPTTPAASATAPAPTRILEKARAAQTHVTREGCVIYIPQVTRRCRVTGDL